MATKKTQNKKPRIKKRVLFVWGSEKRGWISERGINDQLNAINDSIHKNREAAARYARLRRQNPPKGIEYHVAYEKPANK